MGRAIAAGAGYRTRWRDGGLEVEGPDEDAFTLAAGAVEALLLRNGRTPASIDSIDLAGASEPEAEWGLPELVGAPEVAARVHGPGAGAVGSAIAAASRAEGPGCSLVVVVDVARAGGEGSAEERSGAASVAFELRSGPGLTPVGHGERRHPVHRAPDATAWVDAAARSGALSSGARGGLQLVAREAPPVLLAFWNRRFPEMSLGQSPQRPEGLGAVRSVPTALAVRDLSARLKAGDGGVVATIHGETSSFCGFRSDGGVSWVGAWSPVGGTTCELGSRPGPEVRRSVSEGAYLPRPRYVENLPSRWRFIGERCGSCHELTFPARGRCRACGAIQDLVAEPLPLSGEVVASTVVRPGAQPTEFDPLVASQGGYGVVLVELAPRARATLAVADLPGVAPAIGSRVSTQLRRLYATEGEWRYGRKALAVPTDP